MQPSRLPRFKRASTIAAIALGERDREIMRLVLRHRFLRSSHIVSLLGGTQQSLLRRLQLLYHHGLLERPRAQLDYYHQPGSRHIVYGLGSKGAALLKEECGFSFAHLRWSEKNRSVGRMFLQHALLVSDFMVALELACRQNGNVRLIRGEELIQTSLRWQVMLDRGVKLGLIPDQVFALEYEDADGVTQRGFFFLEADRGTMPVVRNNLKQTSFFRKLLAYEATWSQGIHREKFGFHRFRVLTVTTSAARVGSLVEACGKLKRGHGLFLFVPKDILGKDVFSPVWQTGRGESAGLVP